MRRVSSHILKNGQYFNHTTYRLTIKPSFISRCLCTVNENKTKPSFSDKISKGPGLHEFISTDNNNDLNFTETVDIPYLKNAVSCSLQKKKVYFYVYGCQMNVNDTEVVWSILKKNNYSKTEVLEEADVILLVTCAIRDNAEIRIWNRLDHLRGLKKRRSESLPPLKIGILGCMAERLKHQLLEKEKCIDIVAGPDSYKDLPHLLNETENNQTAINVMLSLDETYADVMPVRLDSKTKTAYVTIMRGCDNMCTYCIVPFTRGRERSRPIQSILDEIKHLSESGIKEVTLLGQNVNSYRYLSQDSSKEEKTQIVKGFKTVYKPKMGGIRFADLLDQVSLVDPEMRIRFTSPHPKDFPDEVLYLIKERPNVCKSLHLPFQAGSSAVLERMRRGYTKEAYLDLVQHVRNILPKVSLSTDVICGFCGETEEEFQDTLAVMEQVKFNIAYTFAYSMREKTAAHRRYVDDIPYEIKEHRLRQVANVFRKGVEELNRAQIGETQLVLIEGKSRKSESMLAGRNDGNIKVLIPNMEIPGQVYSTNIKPIQPGDYVAVKIEHSTSQTLRGTPLYHCNITSFHTQSFEDKQSLRNSL